MADIIGTSGDDILVQNANEDDRIDGGAGVDTLDLSGMGEAARLFLALATPQAIGASQGLDSVANIENAIGTAFNDLIVGVNGGSHLSGGAGDDQLQGRGGADVLDGGIGDDLLLGRAGDDVLSGSSGKDVLRPGEGNDSVDGSSGTDRVDFSDVARGVEVDLAAGTARDLDGSGAVNTTMTSIEDVTGTAFDDVLTGDGGVNRLYGRDGNDTIDGGAGNDTLAGGAGDDVISTGGGRDYVVAGSGDDHITTGLGRATVVGEEGQDTIDYSAESRDMFINLTSRRGFVQDGSMDVNDRLYELEHVEAGSGNDTVVGTDADANRINLGAGDDYADGKDGDDIIQGQDGDDTLIGRAGNDDLQGGAGDDYLRGDEGDDLLTAGDGADTLLGNEGADRLIANGADGASKTLTGGAGGDVFELHEGLQTVHITDFASGVDFAHLRLTSTSLSNFADLLALRTAPDTLQIGDLTLVFDGLDIAAGLTGADFGLNGAPLTAPLSDTTHEDVNLYSTDLLAGQSDPEGDTLSVLNIVQTGGPEANFRQNGNNIELFPGRFGNLEAGQQVELVFEYDVSDGANVSTNTLTLIVEGRNELLPTLILPTARDDAASLSEDGATTVNAVANDSANTILLANNKQVVQFDASAFDGTVSLQTNKKVFEIDANGAFDYLAVGESVTQSIHYAMQNAVGGRDNAFIDITVTGANDGILGFTVAPSAALTERAETDNGASVDILMATGAISFSDADLSDQHSFTITPQGADYRGALTASVVSTAADGARAGQWLFEVSDGDLDDLSEGEVLTQSYDIVAEDGHGSSAMGSVTITLTGTNDSVALISIDNVFGDIKEELDGSASENSTTHSAGGTLTFDDVDLNDTHTVSVVPADVNYRGTVTTVLSDSTGIGQGGTTWLFEVNDADLDDLGEGQTLTQTYDLIVSDGFTQITETLTITLSGTNDAPVIGVGDVAGGVTELVDNDPNEGTAILSASGSLAFTDVDLIDTHIVSATAQGTGYRGTFTPTVIDSTGTGAGQINWLFEVSDNDLDDLAEGQTVTQTYEVLIDDRQGGSDVETVTITLTGTNDAPIVTGALNSGAVQELAEAHVNENNFTHEVGGTVSFFDIDFIDTHSVRVIENGNQYRGSVSADAAVQAATQPGDGVDWEFDWGFSVADSDLDNLAKGQTITQSYTLEVTDSAGATATQDISIILTGVNDDPTAVDDFATGLSSAGPISNLAQAAGTEEVASVANWFGFIPDGSANGPVSLDGQTFVATSNFLHELTIPVDRVSADFNFLGGTSTNYTFNVYIAAVTENAGQISTSSVLYQSGPFNKAHGNDALTFNLNNLQVTAGETYAVILESHINQGTMVRAGGSVNLRMDTAGNSIDGYYFHTSTADLSADFTEVYGADMGIHIVPSAAQTILVSDLLPNDSDVDGDSFSVTAVAASSAKGGIVQLHANGSITYDPTNIAEYQALPAGQELTDSFTYTITDQHGATDTATVYLGVDGRSDIASVSGDTTGLVQEDLTLSVSGKLNITDEDPGEDHFQIPSDLNGTYGAFTFDADGNWTYSVQNAHQDVQALGAAELLYETLEVISADGSIRTTIRVQIAGTNDVPVVNAVVGATNEDGPAINLTADFSDKDASDAHTFSLDATGTLGSVTNNGDGTFGYDPNGQFEYLAVGETATDTFIYFVDDQNGGITSNTMTVIITGQNDAPLVNAVTGGANEDGPAITLAADFSDVDASDTHSFSVDTTGTLGSVTNNGDGTFGYDPNGAFESLAAGETATDTFTYTVDDGNGGVVSNTMTVTITGTNDAPVVQAVTGGANEDGPAITLAADFADVDASDTHLFSVDTTGTVGSVTNNNDGTFGYDPNGQFEYLAVGETATDTFTYIVDDQNGGVVSNSMTITITGTNDAPLVQAVTGGANEDGPAITLAADFSDVDASDSHVFTIDTTGTLGSVTNNNDGTFGYDPNGQFEHLAVGETATDTFIYFVDDQNGGVVSNSMTITITGTNDDPVVQAVTGGANEDGPAITLTADFSDADASDTHSFSVDTTGTVGSVTNNNDGTFGYDPNGQFEHLAVGETATDSFIYFVDDQNGGVVSNSMTITITGTNDDPVASNDDFTHPDLGTESDTTQFRDASYLDQGEGHAAARSFVAQTFTAGAGALEAVSLITNHQAGADAMEFRVLVTEFTGSGVTFQPTDVLFDSGKTVGSGPSQGQIISRIDTGNLGLVEGSRYAIVIDFVSDRDGVDGYGRLSVTAAQDRIIGEDMYISTSNTGDPIADYAGGYIKYESGGNPNYDLALTFEYGPPALTDEESTHIFAATDLLDNDNDVDATDSLTIAAVDGSASTGSVVLNGDGTVTYDPNGAFEDLAVGETATDTFTYTISDGNGGTDTATVTLAIEGVNDAPVAVAITGTVGEDDVSIGLSPNFTDEDASDTHTLIIDDSATVGAVAPDGAGGFIYGPNNQFEHLAAGETATDTFSYTVNDGHGGADTATATITITGANDAPTLNANAAVSIDENQTAVAMAAIASDVDNGDGATFEISGGADAALFSIDAGTGDLSFLAAPDFEAPADDDGDNIYDVEIVARDNAGAASAGHAVAITVMDVNENVPYTPHLFSHNSGLFIGLEDSNGDDLVDRFDTSTGLAHGTSYGLASADFNNDGLIDLAKSDFNNGARVHINQGDSNNNGVPEFVSSFESDIPNARSLEADDVNNDGLPDLLIAGSGSFADGVLINQGDPDGDGNVDFAPVILAGASAVGNGHSYGIGAGDFDGDGHRDVVVTQWTGGPTQIFYGEGDPDLDGLPNFSAASNLPEPASHFIDIAVSAGDLDNDGDEDIVVGYWSSSLNNVMYLNQGDTNGDGVPDFTAHELPDTATLSYALKLADFDSDGLLDMAYSDNNNTHSSVLINQGDTNGDDVPEFSKIDLGLSARFLDVGDVDGDGDWDIALSNTSDLTVAHNMGDTDNDGLVNFTFSPTVAIGDGFRIELVEDFIGV